MALGVRPFARYAKSCGDTNASWEVATIYPRRKLIHGGSVNMLVTEPHNHKHSFALSMVKIRFQI